MDLVCLKQKTIIPSEGLSLESCIQAVGCILWGCMVALAYSGAVLEYSCLFITTGRQILNSVTNMLRLLMHLLYK